MGARVSARVRKENRGWIKKKKEKKRHHTCTSVPRFPRSHVRDWPKTTKTDDVGTDSCATTSHGSVENNHGHDSSVERVCPFALRTAQQ